MSSDTPLTVPNLLSVLRLLGAPGLVVLAGLDRRHEMVALFVVIAVSDWVDGKLAVALDQRSDLGPRLDSVADHLMYISLLVSALLLDASRVASEWAWIAAPIAAYCGAGALSLSKFGRWPHHHTTMAKISWGLMLIGGTTFLLGWSAWPLRMALVGATLASVQSMQITWILRAWRADIPSVAAARRIRASDP